MLNYGNCNSRSQCWCRNCCGSPGTEPLRGRPQAQSSSHYDRMSQESMPSFCGRYCSLEKSLRLRGRGRARRDSQRCGMNNNQSAFRQIGSHDNWRSQDPDARLQESASGDDQILPLPRSLPTSDGTARNHCRIRPTRDSGPSLM